MGTSHHDFKNTELAPRIVEERAGVSFCIGICASDASENLPNLLKRIESERLENSAIQRIIIVASGCTLGTLAGLRDIARSDHRIQLIEEPTRYGKGEAVNRIIEKQIGEFLVLVNSDAIPDAGAINTLLELIDSDVKVGVISASPFFEHSNGIVSDILELMWSLHNDSSLSLNHAGINNHASDELMVIRSHALGRLPTGVVNDGAYIAGMAFLRGFRIRFSDQAHVKIEVPRRLTDLIQQRRRILFGHFQVWKWLGQSPHTVELMLFSTPTISLRLLVKRLARTPSLLKILPVAAVSESAAFLLAVKDVLTSASHHAIWRRFSD